MQFCCTGFPLEDETDLDYDEDTGDARPDDPKYMRWYGSDVGGIRIVTHCSYECPMYFVAIASTVTKAWRGYPQRITELGYKLPWDGMLKGFCSKNNLKTSGEPGWYLCSLWG